ncbi:MAG: 3'-5' exonuclease [Succinivibrionaceae bacterium]|nr:3'-5' exonuclease [Succinivibrionaceae bacterium]
MAYGFSGNRPGKGKSLCDATDNYTVVDVETTGLDSWAELIEIGAVRVRGHQVAEEFQIFVRPSYSVPREITMLTGITNSMVRAAPLPDEAVKAFLKFAGGDILLGHNVNFDVNFLYDASRRFLSSPLANDFVDTRKLTKKFFPHLADHKLATLKGHFRIVTDQAHRAVHDCVATKQVYDVCRLEAEKNGMNVEQYFKSIARAERKAAAQRRALRGAG